MAIAVEDLWFGAVLVGPLPDILALDAEDSVRTLMFHAVAPQHAVVVGEPSPRLLARLPVPERPRRLRPLAVLARVLKRASFWSVPAAKETYKLLGCGLRLFGHHEVIIALPGVTLRQGACLEFLVK